jgi:hypothetical protein
MPYPPSPAPTWSSRSARFPQSSPSLDYRRAVIGLALGGSLSSRGEARGPDARMLEVAGSGVPHAEMRTRVLPAGSALG